MAFSALKTILVIGATGAQGIPVVRALTRDRAYAVRAMTRNADSPDAKLISSWPNVQLEVGDCFDEGDLRKAFRGVKGAFVNTNGYVTGEKGEVYWGKLSVLHIFLSFTEMGKGRGEM